MEAKCTNVYSLLLYCVHLYFYRSTSFKFPPTVVLFHCLCCFTTLMASLASLLTMGGSTGLECEHVTSEYPRVPELPGARVPGTPKREVLALWAMLVGVWYLTCLSSCSVSWGTALKGELKIPGRWKGRQKEWKVNAALQREPEI